jgi:hypothetical protein
MRLSNFFENTGSVKEDIGNLAQLNLGPMINLLRQRRYYAQSKFDSNVFGTQNEIVDGGILKNGLKGIRKAYRDVYQEGSYKILWLLQFTSIKNLFFSQSLINML